MRECVGEGTSMRVSECESDNHLQGLKPDSEMCERPHSLSTAVKGLILTPLGGLEGQRVGQALRAMHLHPETGLTLQRCSSRKHFYGHLQQHVHISAGRLGLTAVESKSAFEVCMYPVLGVGECAKQPSITCTCYAQHVRNLGQPWHQ